MTINSPEALQALKVFVDLMTHCGPPNVASIGQTDLIQLFASGKLATAQVGFSTLSSYNDPTKSAVVGKFLVNQLPSAAEGKPPGIVIGNWNMGVPANIPESKKKAAVAFLTWFTSKGAQEIYLANDAPPLRTGLLTPEMMSNPGNEWMKIYVSGTEHGTQVLGYKEGAAVEQALGLRLNQALLGQMSPAAALNRAANEIYSIFKASGRKTGKLPPLPE